MKSDTLLALYVPSLTGGGAQQVTVNLANGFANRGINVDLVVSYLAGELVDQVSNKVSIVDLKTVRIPVVGVAASIPAIIRYLRREAPDVMFSQMHYANVVSVTAHQMAAKDIALVLTDHTIFGSTNQRKDALMFALAKRLYPFADHVLAVSSGVAESVRNEVDIADEQLSVINNPIVTSALRESAEASVNHPWLQSTDSDVILGVGRLVPEKDFTTLIQAVATASETEPSLHLIILGEGPRREALTRIAADLGIDDRVSLPGYVENPYAYMRRADVFALSSKREGLPTALVEAMACGCPVVATDCQSGPREILLGGKYGPLVPVGNPRALATGIEEILQDPLTPDVLKGRAEDFSVETVLDEYEQLINQLI